MAVSKKSKSTKNEIRKTNQEIWGVIFFSLGLLLAIALISFMRDPKDNILGPIFGSYLSSGLVYIFGKIPSFFLPILCVYMGILLIKNAILDIRKIVYCSLLIFELCVLLTIHTIAKTSQPDFSFYDNCIGHSTTYLLHYLFGTHSFGPYFLFIVATFLTLSAFFEINIKNIFCSIANYFELVVLKCIHGFGVLVGNRKREKKTKVDLKDSVLLSDSTYVPHKKNPTGKKSTNDANQREIDEEAQRLEKELAEFRAKRNAPITITTLDKEDAPPLEEELPMDDANIHNAEAADPTLFADDTGEEKFCKVPSSETKKIHTIPTKPYSLPSPDILPQPPESINTIDRQYFVENSHILEKTLLNFAIEGKVVQVSPGPVVTRYEIELAPGIKISKIVNLQDDLSMAVGGKKIRIEAPIPGKAAIGIELPNNEMHLVSFKQVLISDVFRKTRAKLPIIIGKNISGIPFVSDVTRMPHLLIAGQTGSGKSVAINSFLCSLLMTKKPDELRLILIDPKKVEMSYYENIPHLMAPVVTESKEAVKALQWGVMEMTRRYRLLAKVHARNIDSFNQKIREKTVKEGVISDNDNKILPFIVIIVDELADLMLTASKDVEGLIQRIAQLARAVGIHLIVATQRPSVDIITGPIKANLTSRIAFRTIQSTDSRTILGCIGAEKLLGRGDMLFLRNGAPDIERFHGSFISEEDVEIIVEEIKKQHFETEKIESFEDATNGAVEIIPGVPSTSPTSSSSVNGRDEKFEEAVRLIVSTGLGSTSLIQRRLKLGYARAGRLMDELHEAGIVGPQEGSKVREVLVTSDVLKDMFDE